MFVLAGVASAFFACPTTVVLLAWLKEPLMQLRLASSDRLASAFLLETIAESCASLSTFPLPHAKDVNYTTKLASQQGPHRVATAIHHPESDPD